MSTLAVGTIDTFEEVVRLRGHEGLHQVLEGLSKDGSFSCVRWNVNKEPFGSPFQVRTTHIEAASDSAMKRIYNT